MWTDPDSSSQKHVPWSLKLGQYREAEEPHNKPGCAENNSTDSQTPSEKSHNTRCWEHNNSKCSPPAPAALRTGTADEGRGTPGRAVWRPICSTTQAVRSSRALGIHHPPPSVPQFPSFSSQCIPHETASSAKRAFFFFFLGWGKTQHPARWNLATVCLLVLTEFETLPHLSGDVVSLLLGSLMLWVCR